MIASGKADFAISAQENVTLARVEGIPVVSVERLFSITLQRLHRLRKTI